MPVAGNEETGVNPMAWQSSGYGAGIPIKKRRFPIIRSPSPPPDETPPLHADNHSVQNPSQGSILLNVVESSSLGLPDAKINSIPGETKGSFGAIDVMVSQSTAGNSSASTDIKPVANSDRFSGIKLEESSIAYQSLSPADVDRENKLMGKLLINSAKTELKLAPSENVDVPERSTLSRSTELSLGVKGNLNSALAGQNPRQNQESVGAVSLNLSVSKVNCDKSDKVELNTTTNRCNWDLNTTMDAWGGSESDTGGVGEATISSELKTVVKTNDINPSCMTTSGNTFLGASECNDPLSTIPFAVPISFQGPLRFCLSSSIFPSNIGQQPSSSSAKADSNTSSLTRVLLPGSNLDIVNVNSVKSEPHDESVKRDSSGPSSKSTGLSGFREMKREFIEKCNFQLENSGNVSIAALEDVSKSIKTECVNEGDQEAGVIQNMLKQLDSQAGLFALSTTGGGNSSKSTEPWVNTEVNRSTAEMSHEANGITSRVVPRPDCNEAIILRGKDIVTVETKYIYNPEHCRSKSMNDLQHESHAEGPVSDKEKINLSGDMLEEYHYGSEYVLDGNQDGRREDEFEDGEFRELQEHSPIDRKKIQLVNNHADLAETHPSLIGVGHQISYRVTEEDTKEDHGETRSNINQSVDVVEDKKTIDKDDSSVLQSFSFDVLDTECEEKNLAEVVQREPLDALESVQGAEKACENAATNGSQGTSNVTAQESDQNVNRTGLEEKTDLRLHMTEEASLHDTDSGLPMTEACLHDNTAKDISSGGNRGRIINLAQPSTLSSPSKTRSISDRSLPSAERLPDVALEGDKLHHRGRGEIYSDNSCRFSRERHQDYSSRNLRMNYGRGRGRGRMNHLRGDWNSGFDDFYSFPAEPRGGPRHKFASGCMDADIEFNGYDIGPDDTFVGTGRRGRKPINDDAPNFHRRSPGERDGPISHGPQMNRKIPRNVGQESSESGGMRHSEKFISGFTDDNADPAFLHPRHQFEGLDGNFVRGNKNFSSVQRRGLPRVRSKFPIRSRTRSPGRRASPGRSSDGFPELPHRRSPQIFKNMERMRSPDHPCFRGENVVRRHGNEFSNDMDSGWEHNPRSGRTFLRNGRRFNVSEREDGNEFFSGPGRFDEMVGGDGNGEERRGFGERRGGYIRHFRPPYNSGANGNNNFCVNVEDGPRPFRYGPEDSTEFHQRGPLRDNKGFDRRITKNRPENVHRRTRNIEEQEENFRHGCAQHRRTRNIEEQEENFRHGCAQPWHEDDGFGDISRMKRKRF